MTRNEARKIIGLEPVDGADGLYISATLFPLNEEAVPTPEVTDNDEDAKDYEEYLEEDFKNDEITNFPKRGDDKKISLRNSNYPQFDYEFSSNVKDGNEDIWRAGGNIRGNEAFMLWSRARQGSETPAVLDWIKEREAWAARHFRDGRQFSDGSLEPNLSNVAGVISQLKWGVIGTLGEQGMKDVVLELTKKLEGRKDDLEFSNQYWWMLIDEKDMSDEEEEKQVSAKVKEALKNKVDEHNEKYGSNPTKRVNLRTLEAVFRRGVGAFNQNPSSVRPAVRRQGGADRWAYARTNSYLFALRTGRFQGGKHDTDLFPKGHPLSSK